MWGYILLCHGCLADISIGAKDLERVSDHTLACSPRYKTEDEAYWAGAAKQMEREALEIENMFESEVLTYEYKRNESSTKTPRRR